MPWQRRPWPSSRPAVPFSRPAGRADWCWDAVAGTRLSGLARGAPRAASANFRGRADRGDERDEPVGRPAARPRRRVPGARVGEKPRRRVPHRRPGPGGEHRPLVGAVPLPGRRGRVLRLPPPPGRPALQRPGHLLPYVPVFRGRRGAARRAVPHLVPHRGRP